MTTDSSQALLSACLPPQPPLHPCPSWPQTGLQPCYMCVFLCLPPQSPLHPCLSWPQTALQPCCLCLPPCRPYTPVFHGHRQLSSHAVYQSVSVSVHSRPYTPVALWSNRACSHSAVALFTLHGRNPSNGQGRTAITPPVAVCSYLATGCVTDFSPHLATPSQKLHCHFRCVVILSYMWLTGVSHFAALLLATKYAIISFETSIPGVSSVHLKKLNSYQNVT